jgi:hypothetical protein
MSEFAVKPEVLAVIATPDAAVKAAAEKTTEQPTAAAVLDDGYPADLRLPIRYVKGMGGDLAEARRRWIDTLKVGALSMATALCFCRF